MPVTIDQNTIDIRMTWLDIEKERLILRQAKVEDDEFKKLQKEVDKIDAKMEELEDWLHILNQDPGWGDLVNLKGKRVPKMPTFKTTNEMLNRLEDPTNWERGLDHEQTARAREFNAARNAQEAVFVMDGAGPVADLLKQGKSEEEILEILREKDAKWAKTSRSSEPPPSNEDS